MSDPFIRELAAYLVTQQSHFSLNSNLKVGELTRGVDGVYCLAVPSGPPDMYSPLKYPSVEFWSVNKSSSAAFTDLEYVYDVFHQSYAFTTTSYFVFAGWAMSEIEDMDRDSTGRKMWRLSLDFVIQANVS